MLHYSIADFKKVLNDGFLEELPNEIIDIINKLAKQVGAPEYNKTPQFGNKSLNNNTTIGSRRRKKTTDLNDDEWESMRSFQTTDLKKKEGIESNLFTIRKYLNMLTLNTYDNFKNNIFEEIELVNSTKTPNDFNYICNSIFTIVTGNILYSNIYAKLYKDLIKQYEIFKTILMKHFDLFEDKINCIEYYDPDKDYDKFCENNKKNELLRANCTFYINSMKENIIDNISIYKNIINLFNILDTMISSGTKKNELDELSELIYIMVINSYNIINKDCSEYAKVILDNTIKITKIKLSENPGITNKCIFKHMDILDEISN